MASPTHGSLKLRTVSNELDGVKHKAYEIGIQLGISRSKMLVFRQEGDMFTAAIDFWLSGNVKDDDIPVSWSSIVAALESKQVGEVGLATTLHAKYCLEQKQAKDDKGEVEQASQPSLHPNIQADLRFQLNENIRLIKRQYASYVRCIRLSLRSIGTTVEDFRAFLLSLDAFQPNGDANVKLFSDKEEKLKKETDIEGIFGLLTKECASFFNFEIFQSIIEEYDIDRSQEKLNYPTRLQEYINKHNLKEFYEINPRLEELTDDSKELILKLDMELTRTTGTLKDRIEAIARVMELKPSSLRLVNLKEGCVIVTLILPVSVAKIIFTSEDHLSLKQKSDLQALSVMWLKCNNCFIKLALDTAGANSTSTKASIHKPKGVEEVREMVWRLHYLPKKEGITATPLHKTVESSDTENVKNLLKGTTTRTESKTLTSKQQVTSQLSEYHSNKTDILLKRFGMKKLLDMSFYKNLLKKLYIDSAKFENISATPLHKATESDNMKTVREELKSVDYSVNCTDSIGWTPLHYACAVGNLDMVRMLVSEFKADTSIQDDDGCTALMLAALAGHDTVVHTLLEYQCPVDTKDKHGNGLLAYACAGGNVNIARTLIHEHNADGKAANFEGDTPLHLAIWCDQGEAVLTQIKEFRFDPNTKGGLGRSLLHDACSRGNVSLVQALIREHNADVLARDDENNTPLHVAALCGQHQVALTLINEFGCDTTVTGVLGRSLLHCACDGGSVRLVQALIREHNADVLARDDENDTPLHVAAFCGQDQVALTLISEFGCDTTVTGSLGRSLLHSACQGGSVSLVQTLIREHNADILARDDQNNTPLHVAAFCGQDQVALTLINEFGCDTTVTGSLGRSLLHSACQGGSVSLVQALIREHNADILARDDVNDTPLHVAAFCGQDQVALTLINEFRCDTTVTGRLGRSLLHSACQGGSVSLVQVLIRDHNADILAMDDNSNTPLQVASLRGHGEVALTIINLFGCDPNLINKFGRTLLHNACQGGNINLVLDLILDHNANVNARDDYNNTPLLVAVMHGHENLATILRDNFGATL